MEILRALLGMVVFVGIAWALSQHRRRVNWRLVASGLALQLALSVLFLKVPGVSEVFLAISRGFVSLINEAAAGARFVFGGLSVNSFEDSNAGHSLGFIVAFQVLPLIVFFSAFSSLLYYLGILQRVVYVLAWLLTRTLRISGAESLSAAGNVFLGQTEAPLLVKPYIAGMTRSELLCLMAGGMATLAGGVLVAYISFLGGGDPEAQARVAAMLLTASVMNAPAAIVFSKLLLPEVEQEQANTRLDLSKEKLGANVLDAVAIGARDGMHLAMNVGAMLVAFVGIIAVVNYILGEGIGAWGLNDWIASSTGGVYKQLNLQYLLGQLFRIPAWLTGVDWSETLQVGSLLGQKTAINEFLAYKDLSELKAAGALSPRAIAIATFALCGFSNFGSIAIQIGGIGAMAPNQQVNLSRLGLRALLAASLACLLTATLAGMYF